MPKTQLNTYFELEESDLKFKFKALELHVTQLRKDPFPRSIDNLRRLAELRGKEIGADAAEGFIARRFTA
jgi:hypothetical protein